jgi:tRNA A-37 threonylcarbamoyl transferase component Bud32
MIDPEYKNLIEEQLDEKIERTRLVTETKPSYIFHIWGKRQYILKQTKRIPLHRQFENHKRIFKVWLDRKEELLFKIPEPYLLGPKGKYVLMEYVDGKNLLDLLLAKKISVNDLFHRAGRALHQYHGLAKNTFSNIAIDIRNCDSVREILAGPKGPSIEKALNSIPADYCGVVFKDFTPSNVIIDQQGAMYFLDVQEYFYWGPLAYDCVRFVDTTRVFSLVSKPSMILSFDLVKQATNAFLEGYGENNDEYFRIIQSVHRAEHVHIKITRTKMRGIILKLLYMIV